MKKTHKKVLGSFGLVAVAAMTAFAAFIPIPETQAVSSVTDTVIVRVIGTAPMVSIEDPPDGSVFTGSGQTLTYHYENVNHVTITLEYVNGGGSTTPPITIGTFDPSEEYGDNLLNFNFDDYGYGYGDYVIKVIGEGGGGEPTESAIMVSYLSVTGTVSEDEETGDANVRLIYSENSSDISVIELNVYDLDGNLIEELSPIRVPKPGKNAVIPFSETDLPGGQYIIKITALDVNGNPLHTPYELVFDYNPVEVPEVPDTNAPDTGGLMTMLNISQTDYLVTGLLVFFIVGVAGIYVVAKGRRADNKKRR